MNRRVKDYNKKRMSNLDKRKNAKDYLKNELFAKTSLSKEECVKAASTFSDAFSNYYLIDYLHRGKLTEKKMNDYFFVELNTNNQTSVFLSESEEFNSFAILQPDCNTSPTFITYFLGGGIRLIKDNGFMGVFHMLKYGNYITSIRNKLVGTKPWYLYYLGTKKSKQSMGYGSKILRSILSYMDSIQSEIYLETNELSNTDYYKKFGFELVGEYDCADFKGYCMLRKPKEENS